MLDEYISIFGDEDGLEHDGRCKNGPMLKEKVNFPLIESSSGSLEEYDDNETEMSRTSVSGNDVKIESGISRTNNLVPKNACPLPRSLCPSTKVHFALSCQANV